jgi:hypothetical protein
MEKKNIWSFGTREVVYGAIGAALVRCVLLGHQYFPAARRRQCYLPSLQSLCLIFFGVAYGPWAGLLAGFIGNYAG